MAVVNLSTDIKIEDDSKGDSVSALKTMDGDAISTVSQKNVYEVTLLSHSSRRRQLHEERSSNGTTNTSSVVVADVTCSTVLEAISSIQKGNDGSLVKMAVRDGKFWQPRASAAYYQLHENSFGIDQIYLDEQRDVSYDVTCEISKEDCENVPGTPCEAVAREDSFGGAFDGDIPSTRRRRLLAPCGYKSDTCTLGRSHTASPCAPVI